jgi:hypothetical protein
MIDCSLKDEILFKIVRESPEMTFAFDSEDSMEIFGFDQELVSSVLDYFEDIGLIDQDKYLEGEILLEILIPAHDLVSRGGFTAKEELLTKNIARLLVEIESLKPLMPEKVESIGLIASGIASGLALMKSKKNR